MRKNPSHFKKYLTLNQTNYGNYCKISRHKEKQVRGPKVSITKFFC
jgi:hypothetical protein